MKVLVANPPAYLWDDNRRYVHGGSRWSHSMSLSKNKAEEMIKKGDFPYTPYPFYLGYAASYVSTLCDLFFIDGVVLNYNQDEFIHKAIMISPDLLVIEAPTLGFSLIMEVCKIIKEHTQCKVAVTGIHVSSEYLQSMAEFSVIDYILLNEFEETLRDLIEKNLDGTGIKGLLYRNKGKIVNNGPRPVIKNISALPFPFRDQSAVFYNDFTLVGNPNIQILTSRGCPVGCRFCYTTAFFENPIYRGRNADNVVEEIKYVIDRFHPKQLYFDDDTITINPKHIKEVSEAIIKEGIDIPWTCMGDITVKRDTLKLMKKAGCIGMKFGVESPNPETLKKMHKGIVTANNTMKFREMLKEEKIWAHATFSLGHPGDNPEVLKATIDFARKLSPNSLQTSIATPIVGTPFYKESVEQKWIITDNYNAFDGNKGSVLSYDGLSNRQIDAIRSQFEDFWNKERLKPIMAITNIIYKRKLIMARIMKNYPKVF
jgi:radical SAM superfamily enzyme YgiQ (UPF0313 family)